MIRPTILHATTTRRARPDVPAMSWLALGFVLGAAVMFGALRLLAT